MPTPSRSEKQPSPRIVVAIPAMNEEERLERCLGALCRQRDLDGGPLRMHDVCIAVLANNCTDGTAALARSLARHAPPDHPTILVRDVQFAPEHAHAGRARRTVMDWAADLLGDGPGGIICSTDADSEAHPDWLAQIDSAFAQGADAVAGTVEFDADEAATLALPAARRLEARFSTLQAEIMARLCPEPGDPWPNHIWAWGANLAVSRQAYLACGGSPDVGLAEDRALVACLLSHDFRIRHSLDVRVTTSCRTVGRAPGGLADLVAIYSAGDTEHPCDAELLPADVVEARARCRALLRDLYCGPDRPERGLSDQHADALGLRPDMLAEALAQPCFGQAWTIVAQHSTAYYERRFCFASTRPMKQVQPIKLAPQLPLYGQPRAYMVQEGR